MNAMNQAVMEPAAIAPDLLAAIEKWLGAGLASRCRLEDGDGKRRDSTRYVRIAVPDREQIATMYFFLHDDGTWNVYPQQDRRPEMFPPRLLAA
jgi:hypothetical protein